ncbi:phosphatidylinositol-4-phosphate 5-kinase, putative [Ricinus communis]|uniref:1-phosphatidylinositol-3-phosphate 5-kinase n=1 Tax=Ricinus communis TaxID=3988 RepID=B9T500_RICCO|nr:phosphatidylinositol-4-phosphate 5-kinase, putative [Ricinus communis]
MCHCCGAQLPKSENEKRKLENENSLKSNGEGHGLPCRFCQEKQEQGYIKQNSWNPTSPIISPTTSLSSNDRSVSSCSELSVDVNYYDRGSQEEGAVDKALEDVSCRPNGHLHKASEAPVNAVHKLYKVTENNLKESHQGNDIVRDIEIMAAINGQETKDNFSQHPVEFINEGNDISHSIDDDMNAQVWEPPEADSEDEWEGSVAFNDDDDDECGDGTMWGKPSSFSCCRDEGSGSYRFKEEKQKAIEEVANGKFKTIVSQLLTTAGVASMGKDCESWVDIVSSLSWEAASYLKPDAIDGKRMDPDGYVKVKCIATGSRKDSQVVKGLVFKKHAAHKHMPTNYKNPRLLLIRGVLGQSSSGLSSFKSMELEKDNLKSLMDRIEMCHPNVVLVEKSVARDVQESILAKGMTLVYDNEAPSPRKILLKGSHSDELKRVKCVVQIAVIMAYNLILETLFLFDWEAMLANVLLPGVVNTLPIDYPSSVLGTADSIVPSVEESGPETGPPTVLIPISNEFSEEGSHNLDMGSDGNSLSYVPYDPVIFSGFSSLSASLKKVIGDNFSLASSAQYQSLADYFGFNGKEGNRQIAEAVPVLETKEASDHCDVDSKDSFDEEKPLDDGKHHSLRSDFVPVGSEKDVVNEDQVQSKNDVNAVLDSQSILVLVSSRNALRGTICEQSHFSHIMFYRNFDIPLGTFLRDNLLNQRRQCTTCSELPEAHFYYYAHHNKQLTIQVKRLPKILPGEAEGKLWMWSCCGKCKYENRVRKCTKRVVISSAARRLSFGKFLELSFSCHSSFGRLSSCGHYLERDFLYFFGLGPMVAMFKYSPVMTYTVSLPPQMLEFNHSIRYDGLKREFEDVYSKGRSLFSGIADILKKLRLKYEGSTLNLGGSLKEFSDIEEMLKHESSEFEVTIIDAVTKSGNADKADFKFLSLNRLLWELLLESSIWERRLHSLLLPDPSLVATGAIEKPVHDQLKSKMSGTTDGRTRGNEIVSGNNSSNLKFSNSLEANELSVKEIPVNGPVQESRVQDHLDHSSPLGENIERSNMNSNSEADNFLLGDLDVERTIPIGPFIGNSDSVIDSEASRKGTSLRSVVSSLEYSTGWFWMPLSEIRQIYLEDLERGFMPKFQSINNYMQEHIPAAYQLISEEGQRIHIPLGTDNCIVRDYDGELSSIIACALAVLKDIPVFDDDGPKKGGMSAKSTEGLHLLTRVPTRISSHWSSNGSSDSDSLHSTLSISPEDSHFSSFDGISLLESLASPENESSEVSFGVAKSLGKGKYSVISLYENQFRDLRSRCCPSEVHYIASLSRCRNWDAKGGKSKCVFAKTLDDRFIIKEIKKTEFESFVKFAPHYFKYMNESFELGNQTCLAKVLGIYQVVIRQTKSGKEVRHDLMVMENLSFGRNITRQYDLKGALHARYNSAADGSGDVLLDQNFVNDMNSSPLYVNNKAKRLLERAVWNDTTFLNSINVMDYSLLVGVDTQRRELVCGIIDYLRQYTWDKQLETWVKSSLVVPKNVLPTVISPKEYKKRFRKFMAAHFLSVPDNWCSQRSSDPCELCGIRNDASSQSKSPKQGG